MNKGKRGPAPRSQSVRSFFMSNASVTGSNVYDHLTSSSQSSSAKEKTLRGKRHLVTKTGILMMNEFKIKNVSNDKKMISI